MLLNLTMENTFWLIVLLIILAVTNIVWLLFLHRKIKKALGGTNSKTILESQTQIRHELENFKKFKTELEKYLETVETRLKRSVQSIETVRFNPFKGTGDGGNQSFSTAFVDEDGNGVVVSGLYSRERVSIFNKVIKNFSSEFELTEEEKSVIENGKKKLLTRV